MEDTTKALEELNIPYKIDTAIEENPSTETAFAAAKLGLEFGADFIIGIGGGSPMDAAKAVGVFMSRL